MASHQSTSSRQEPKWHRGRVRATLTLGAALGLGAIGTGAYWTDQATLAAAPISSGTLDLTLGGDLQGQGGTHTQSSFALATMVPGESVAADISVKNAGSVALRYTAGATASGTLADGLTFEVFPDATAANSGAADSGDRNGSCTGTSSFGPAALTADDTSVIARPRQLEPGLSETVCVVASLPASATNALQGTSATMTVVFDAKQLGAP